MTALHCCLVLGVLSSVQGQDLSRPLQITDNNTTLPDTMQYIQDDLNALGKVEYQQVPGASAKATVAMYQSSNEVLAPVADATRCTLSWVNSNTGKTLSGSTVSTRIGRVAHEASFRDVDHFEVSALRAQEGYYISPAIFVIKGIMLPGKKVYAHFHFIDSCTAGVSCKDGLTITDNESDVPSLIFFFRDETSANLVAKAMAHAAKLCRPPR